MDYKTLRYDVDGEIGILTFNRPEVVNAVNNEMLSELIRFWQERHEDFNVRVIVVRGEGQKGFSSGVDLNEMKIKAGAFAQDLGPEGIYNSQTRFSSVVRLMRSCPQPVVAAVHGAAMGGGLSFALAADVRLASEDAFFCAQYINIGVGGADIGSSYFLWRIVGAGRASEMCLTGRRVYADEAYRMGLANSVHPRDELMPAAMDVARNMVSKSKLGLRLTKDALNAAFNASSLEDTIKVEDRNQAYLLITGHQQP